MDKINIFWHRRDLRVNDNTGLFYALKDTLPVLPIFIFDTNILNKLENKEDPRVQFIHSQLEKINLEYRREKSSLLVFNDTPIEAFKKLLNSFSVNAVFTNRDYEPYAAQRDGEVSELLRQHEVEFYDFKDHVIFEKKEILTDTGAPYKVFTPYKNKWLDKIQTSKIEDFDSDNLMNNLYKQGEQSIPKLADLGFLESSIFIPSNKVQTSLIEKYSNDRDYPALNGTSRMGVHLRFGSISIRQTVRLAMSYSDVWLSELIWRDFYAMVMSNYPNVVDKAFKPKYDHIPWVNNEEQFHKWCIGETGYPIVDAGMRELNQTGHMHNRVRMIVASFLTKHLLIDWHWGERYFASKLLDFELASNNGGWQWAAGTGTDAQPYFRVFNPTSQQEKFDKHFKYIKKWVPEFGTNKYPNPIVDHKFARERAINTYKKALS